MNINRSLLRVGEGGDVIAAAVGLIQGDFNPTVGFAVQLVPTGTTRKELLG